MGADDLGVLPNSHSSNKSPATNRTVVTGRTTLKIILVVAQDESDLSRFESAPIVEGSTELHQVTGIRLWPCTSDLAPNPIPTSWPTESRKPGV
jgi:hypothetical protein